MDDPKLRMTPKDDQPSMAQVLAMMAGVLAELKTAKTDPERDSALKQVELMERLINKTRPENTDHPGKSCYSYPEGDVERPRPELRCKTLWVGHEMKTDTLTPTEIDLLNRLEPGDFRVTKANGAKIAFKVSATYSDQVDPVTGRMKLDQISVWFPCKGPDHRSDHMSMTSYLQQALGEAVPSVEELMREMQVLRAELAKRPQTVGVVA